MAFGRSSLSSGGAGRADVEFRVNTGQFRADVTEARRVYERSTGQMSDAALRMAVAQEKLDRAIDRYGAESRQAKTATLEYRREMRALEGQIDKTGREIAQLDRRGATATTGLRGRFASLSGGVGVLHGRVGALTGGMLAAGGLVYALQQSLSVASSLAEQISKTRQVFGEASIGVERFSQTSARELGLARDQALETASSFGALLEPLGIVGDESARIAIDLTKRGADLASFYNTDVLSALEAVRSGVVGESEPLRRYGGLLSEARVQQAAMAATGKRNASALTDQEKALARVQLILADTARVQGDAARTGGNYAGQMRRLNAQLRDLQGNAGKLAIPVVTDLVSLLNEGAGAANRFSGALSGLTGGFGLGDLAGTVVSRTGVVGGFRNTADLIRLTQRGGISGEDLAKLRQAARRGRLGWPELDQLSRFLTDDQERELRGLIAIANARGAGRRPDDRAGPRGPGGIAAEQRARPRPRPDRTTRTEADIQLDVARAGATTGSADDLAALAELRARYKRQIAALESRQSLNAKQKETLSALYSSLAATQSAIDAIVAEGERKVAEMREREAERRRRERENRRRRQEQGEREEERDMDAFERRTRARDLRSTRGFAAASGFGGGAAAGLMYRDAHRRARQQVAGDQGLTLDDFKRMTSQFLSEHARFEREYASNFQPAAAAPEQPAWVDRSAMISTDMFQLVHLVRVQNELLGRLVGESRAADHIAARRRAGAAFDSI